MNIISHLDKKITKRINLITSFYLSPNKERREEIIKTLKQNISSPYIKNIHLYVDNEEVKTFLMEEIEDEERKIKIIGIGQQAKYSDFFWYCNNNLKNEICMISNGDIWLKHIDHPLILNFLYQKEVVFALTRHEYDLSSPLITNYEGSHDIFMFIPSRLTLKASKFPPKSYKNIYLENQNFYSQVNTKQNVWGSENLVIDALKNRNNKILNPCKNIIIIHEHKTQLRERSRTNVYNRFNIMNAKSFPIYINIYQNENKQIAYKIISYKNSKNINSIMNPIIHDTISMKKVDQYRNPN